MYATNVFPSPFFAEVTKISFPSFVSKGVMKLVLLTNVRKASIFWVNPSLVSVTFGISDNKGIPFDNFSTSPALCILSSKVKRINIIPNGINKPSKNAVR